MSSHVIRRDDAGIAWLILDHPARRNALTPSMLTDFRRHLDDIEADPAVRLVAIRGQGNAAFSAGFDLRSFGAVAQNPHEAGNAITAALGQLADLSKPTIAVLNGHAIGAGCELAVTCDIRWAVEPATLGMPPAKLGLVYAPEGMARFVGLIGPAHTAELFHTARNITAHRAAQIGLVNDVFSAETFEDEIASRLGDMAAQAPLSLAGHTHLIRRISRRALSGDDAAAYDAMRLQAFSSRDAAEGLDAFLEKRAPRFTGR